MNYSDEQLEDMFARLSSIPGYLRTLQDDQEMTLIVDILSERESERRRRGRGFKGKGDLVHIDIGSHNASGKSSKNTMSGTGRKKRSKSLSRGRNSSLEQMLEAHTEKEEKALKKAMLTFYENRSKELEAIARAPPRRIAGTSARAPEHEQISEAQELYEKWKRDALSRPKGRSIRATPTKGSQEARDAMAAIRAMKGKGVKK